MGFHFSSLLFLFQFTRDRGNSLLFCQGRLLTATQRLILLLGKWARIGSCVDRLRTLGRTGNRCLYTADVRHVISQGMRKLCELEDAMEELLDVAENIAFLSCDAHCIREDSLNSIRDRRSQISVIKQEISSIVAVSTSTAPNILFDGWQFFLA